MEGIDYYYYDGDGDDDGEDGEDVLAARTAIRFRVE